MPPYRYRTHGLTFDSAIELPELTAFDGEPDVVIRYGEVPEQLDVPFARGPRYQVAAGQYLLDLPGIARYWVRDGCEVAIAPYPASSEDDIRVFILSSVMGALLHQKGFLAIHASAVEVDGRCVLFGGASGVGKSTLAAAFHQRGHPLVADDLCSISFDAGEQPTLHAGYHHMKLWADALDRVNLSRSELRQVRVGMQKYIVPVVMPPRSSALQISAMFMLSARLAEKIDVRYLTGRSKVAALVRETYRRRMMAGLGRRDEHFKLCARLSRHVPIAVVDRPLYFGDLRRLVQRLEGETSRVGIPA